MDFLKWLPFLNDEKQESDKVDTSLVLPITVGLGTIAASAVLGYRSRFNQLKEASTINESDSSHVTPRTSGLSKKDSAKQMQKNKLPNGVTPKNKASTVVHPTKTDVPHEKPSPAPVAGDPIIPTATDSNKSFKPPSTASIPPSTKKHKKPKRSSQQKTSPETSVTPEDDSSGSGSWVTVTSKKSKNSSVNLTTTKANTNATSTPAPPQKSQSETVKPVQIVPKSVDPVVSKSMKNDSKPPVPQPPKVQYTKELSSLKQTAAPVVTSSASSPPLAPIDPPAPVAEKAKDVPDSSPVVEATPVLKQPTTHLSALDELLSHQLPAQLKAKELECQILRGELIRLREQTEQSVKTKRNLPSLVDASTLTESNDEVTSPSAAQQPSPSVHIPPEGDCHAHGPDEVLLRTLKDEIARLAGKVTTLTQRNANLEGRLQTSQSQLTTAKKKLARDTKSIRQQLDTEIQRAEQAEDTVKQLEAKLQDAVQQTEIQRRTFEEREQATMRELARKSSDYASLLSMKQQWELDRSELKAENERLVKENQDLISHKQTRLSATEQDQCQADHLSKALSDAQARLDICDQTHTSELKQAKDRLTELESLLTDKQQQIDQSQSNLRDLEQTVNDLHLQVDRLGRELTDKATLLASIQAERTRLELEVKQLAKAKQGDSGVAGSDSERSPMDPVLHTSNLTQTDSEPNVEFELSEPLEASPISQSSAREAEENGTDLDRCRLIEQVQHYKAALDATEDMLSKLQGSVDREEQRWREALVASKMECELLESKIGKLENSLSDSLEDRNKLNELVNELQRKVNSGQNDSKPQSPDCSSQSDAGLTDGMNYDENTPTPELLRTIKWLRQMVQIKHEAFKTEQENCVLLQSQLAEAKQASGMDPSLISKSVPEANLNSAPANGEAHTTNGLSNVKPKSEHAGALIDSNIPNGRHSPECEMNGDRQP